MDDRLPGTRCRATALLATMGAGIGVALTAGVALIAILSGAAALFLAPLAVGLVAFQPHAIPVVEIVVGYASSAWWLLGVGGALGAAANRIARGPELPPGASPAALEMGTASLVAGDARGR